MARRIQRHATRLSQVHESALDAVYAAGQRVQTIDGLPGRILFVATSFAPGITEYEVMLDNGMGQGTYISSQLRPIPADYRAGHPGSNLPAGVTAGLEAEAAEAHTADLDYPEMGSVLQDRPDPGQQISVIGARHGTILNDPERFRTAADLYGGPEDPREDDYNGGPNDTGVSWAAPAEQSWMHDNEPPQEEAPPPAFDEEMPPAMARLAQLEEAAFFYGLRHHATTIYDQKIDDHGDAPGHGSIPRASDPDGYDDRSTEAEGDPAWDEPLKPEDKQKYDGATVGMYPEGMSAGGGPSLPIGSVSAARVPWTGHERTELHKLDNGASATDGDFVPSTDFTNRHPVSDQIEDPAPGVIEQELAEQAMQHTAASESDWAAHLRQRHGYAGSDIARVTSQGNRLSDMHAAIHDAGLADHTHEAPDYSNRPVIPEPQAAAGGSTSGDPERALTDSEPAVVRDPSEWSGLERRRRLSSLQAGDEHDAPSFDEADDPGEQDEQSGTSGPSGTDSLEESPDPDEWPMAGTSLNSGGPAYTQGRDDQHGKVFPPPPAPAPPAGQDGENLPGGEDGEDGKGKKISLEISAHLGAFVAAADPRFRFEFTASWRDVVSKARRIRREGKVRLTAVSAGMVIGEVGGDHDVYESGIQRPPHKPQTIQHWACGCPWGSFHQDKSLGSRYAGRPCSHVMALQFEAQSRSMFGRPTEADPTLQELGHDPHDVVVRSMPPWTPSGWSQHWLAPAASLHRTAEMFCPACGDDRDDSGCCYNCGTVSRDLRQEDPLPGAVNASPEEQTEEADEREQEKACHCLYQHEGPCPDLDDELSRTAESWHHARPRDFYSEVTPNPEHNPSGYLASQHASHVLTGYLGPKTAGKLHFSQSDDGHAVQVDMLHTHSSSGHRGVASAMMDDLYSHAKASGAWLNHGSRTEDGNHWWAGYKEPHPEINVHHAHPDEGWQHYWNPRDADADAEINWRESGGRGTHTTARSWDPEDYPDGDRDEQWTKARGLQAPAQQATAALLAAGEDLGELVALAQLSGVAIRYTADQANAPWGADNVSAHPPVKPYGATSPPNKDQDPGSYGPLSAPDPENWGGIQEDSYLQAPLSNVAGLGEPPAVPDQDDQGGFAYVNQANTAGSTTAMDPSDPQGLSMEGAVPAWMHNQGLCERCWQAPATAERAGTGKQVCRDCDEQLTEEYHHRDADLHEEPEPALPSTTGEDDELGRTAGTQMGDQSVAEGLSGGAQQPSPVTQEPGMGSGDEYLSPEDPSIQTMGNQQWSGGGADSGEAAVEPGESSGSIDDIVASFQTTAAAKQFTGGGGPGSDDIAAAAQAFLKTADVLPDHEAAELISEGRGERARNLGLLRLEGTHYEDEDQDLAARGLSLDDYDDDVVSA